MICKIFLITFLNEPKLIFFDTQVNSFPYFHLIRIILFTTIHLFADSFQVFHFKTNISIKHKLLVYTVLNDQAVILKQFSLAYQQNQMVPSIVFMTNNSIKYHSFVYSQLNE